MNLRDFKPLIRSGDIDGVRAAVDANPDLLHTQAPNPDQWDEKADGTHKLGATINLAARAGWTAIVRKHVEFDPLSVHQRGWTGETPLHWASHNGHAEIVALLLDAGADAAVTLQGKTVAAIAEEKRNVRILALIREV